MSKHHTDFYVVRAQFATLPGKPFGLLGDDFLTRDEAWDWATEHFKGPFDGQPSLETLQIWRVQSDVPAQDVTAEYLADWERECGWTDQDWLDDAADKKNDERNEVVA